VREFTVEAGRPDSITENKLLTLKKMGVSRISINPQTMNQSTLDLIGRRHTVNQVKEAFMMARECGMDNINMDFIVGLPQETEDMVKYSMEKMKELNPDSLTIHSLAIKRASRLSMNKKKYEDMPMENSTGLMDITYNYAKNMGMEPYYLYRQKNTAGNQENVGYSKEFKEGIYNILMMGDYQDVWAVGAGAVSKLLSDDRKSATRIDTLKNVDQYISRIDQMIARKKEYFIQNEM
jgi:oxygen-independent coproporphyrinogen-3 oxidase